MTRIGDNTAHNIPGTIKVVSKFTIACTASASTTEAFYPRRGCRIINESGVQVVFDVYEVNPVTGNTVVCEDVAQVTIADDASEALDTALFACEQIKLVLTTGTATLSVVAAE